MPGESVLSAADLTEFRVLAENLALTDSCDILRYVEVPDDEGGWTDTWATLALGVSCRVRPGGLSPRETVVRERVAEDRFYVVTMPALQDITARDQIVWQGKTLEVVGVGFRTDEVLRPVEARLIS